MKMSTQETRTARRIWSVLLCLVMVLGMLPTAALAEEAEPPAGSFSVFVTDEEGKPLPGAKFWLSPQGPGNSYFATSGSDGLATFTEVMSGTYKLMEQIEPDGYVISDDTYIVIVDRENGGNYLYPIDGSPEDSAPFGPGAIIATFVNAPSPEVTLTIPVTKIVRCEGGDPERTTFSFDVQPLKWSSQDIYWRVANDKVTVDGSGSTSTSVQVTTSEYALQLIDLVDAGGILITEVNDGQSGWTYDDTAWIVRKHMVDDGYESHWDDTWDCYRAEETEYGYVPAEGLFNSVSFTNTYTSTSTEVELPIRKIVEQAGNIAPGKEDFTFELLLGGTEDRNGVPIYEIIDTAKITTNGPGATEHTLLFEVPSDTEDETIWYDVYLREHPGSDAGWTYSDALYHVIRSVDNYGDYRYSFILCSERGEADYAQSTADFTNTYTANASSGAITVKKTDAIGNPLAGAVFVLEDSRGSEAYTATSDARGDVLFTDVSNGTYTLREKSAPEGYASSDQSYVISVNGSDVTMGGMPYSSVTFVNRKIAILNRDDHYTFFVGYPDGSFGPSRNMTRAEVTAMFARLITEQIEPDKTYINTFNDVPATSWAANYIGFMQQFGIINGYNGSFRPNDPVTRAEFAAIASRFEKLTEGTASFTDVPSTHWAAKYINFAATRGWVTGYEDGTFRPGNPITRAEVATVTCRLLERIADQNYVRSHLQQLRTFTDMTEKHWAYWYVMESANGHDYTKTAGGEQWSAIHP